MFADLSGTLTTMIALAPMLFIGGYPETVFAPLVGTLLLALVASYIISIVVVPLLSLKILSIQNRFILSLEEWFLKTQDCLNWGYTTGPQQFRRTPNFNHAYTLSRALSP